MDVTFSAVEFIVIFLSRSGFLEKLLTNFAPVWPVQSEVDSLMASKKSPFGRQLVLDTTCMKTFKMSEQKTHIIFSVVCYNQASLTAAKFTAATHHTT